MALELTAKAFITKLQSFASPTEVQKYSRYFKTGDGEYGAGDKFVGVKMGIVFGLAKEFADMPISEIEKLLESDIHEARAGAVSILDVIARKKKTSEVQRQAIFDLYLRRHDRINNWDLVDRAAMYVIGGYLFKRSRDVLYELAKSENLWERRTAIVSTGYFIRQNDLDDTFKIAEILMRDKQDLIHKATGWMLRFAGDKDLPRLCEFLDQYATVMPRTMLRYSIEKLEKYKREHYMKR